MRKTITVSRQLARLGFLSVQEEGSTDRFWNYEAAMVVLGNSVHAHQLEKRRQAYPTQFIDVVGMPFISESYANALGRYQRATQELLTLKTQKP